MPAVPADLLPPLALLHSPACSALGRCLSVFVRNYCVVTRAPRPGRGECVTEGELCQLSLSVESPRSSDQYGVTTTTTTTTTASPSQLHAGVPGQSASKI